MFGTPMTANYTVRRSNRAVYRPHNDPYYHHSRRKPKKKRVARRKPR